jgi:phosphoribosylamine-glycine ligase
MARAEARTSVRTTGTPESIGGARVFHAGTRLEPGAGRLVMCSGRVVAVTATAATFYEAGSRAYRVAQINFAGSQFRRHIAARALAHGLSPEQMEA